MRILIIVWLMIPSSLPQAKNQEDMPYICTTTDSVINDAHYFPRWELTKEAPEFQAFNSLTRVGAANIKTEKCERPTQIDDSHFSNTGDSCSFSHSVYEGNPFWIFDFEDQISGSFETHQDAEVTIFDLGYAPSSKLWQWFDGTITSLCHRRVAGRYTGEIVIESKENNADNWWYLILDTKNYEK